MLIEWYLRRQLDQLNAQKKGRINSVEALVALARLRQVIVPTTAFFYSGPPIVRQFFAVQDQTLATKQRVLQLAGSLATGSAHPMLRAIALAANESGEALREVEADAISEVGVTAKLDRTWFVLGDEACMQQEQIELGVTIQTLTQQFELDGKYTIFLAQKQPKRLLGIFACEYQVNPDLAPSIAELQHQGLSVVLLTETKTRIARGVANQVGISLIHSELDQEDKPRIMATLFKQQPASVVLAGSESEEPPASLPTILLGKKETSRPLALIPHLTELPELVLAARQTVQQAQRRLFWCKIKV